VFSAFLIHSIQVPKTTAKFKAFHKARISLSVGVKVGVKRRGRWPRVLNILIFIQVFW
jgi:hypothetical protein